MSQPAEDTDATRTISSLPSGGITVSALRALHSSGRFDCADPLYGFPDDDQVTHFRIIPVDSTNEYYLGWNPIATVWEEVAALPWNPNEKYVDATVATLYTDGELAVEFEHQPSDSIREAIEKYVRDYAAYAYEEEGLERPEPFTAQSQ